MTIRSVPLASWIHESLRLYRIVLPLILSGVIATTVTLFAAYQNAVTDRALLESVSSHISTLLETGDRPELQRLLKSLEVRQGASFVVHLNGEVVASTRSLTELDKDFSSPRFLFKLRDMGVTPHFLVTESAVRRENGPLLNATIVCQAGLQDLFIYCVLIFVTVLVFGIIVSRFLTKRIERTVSGAIRPIEDLDVGISRILNDFDLHELPVAGIEELDRIRATIIETHRRLKDATDREAEAKAKSLVVEAYQRLVHDLYTPVAALTEVVKVAQEPVDDMSLVERLNARIVRLANQVLNQVSVAKENLGTEPRVLNQSDIRKSVEEAVEQALLAYEKRDLVQLSKNFPSAPVLVPNDPDNLRRAVSNLVSNALRACEHQVEISILVEETRVLIRVSDDGPGIKEEEVSMLIQGRIGSEGRGRVGYGLPSASHIARLHGGRLIYRKSSLGGACFEIRM